MVKNIMIDSERQTMKKREKFTIVERQTEGFTTSKFPRLPLKLNKAKFTRVLNAAKYTPAIIQHSLFSIHFSAAQLSSSGFKYKQLTHKEGGVTPV